MEPTIHKSRPAEHVVLIEIDNPPSNSLAKRMKVLFNDLLDELENDNTIRALIITGRGKSFCAGDDIKEAIQNTKVEGGVINNLHAFGVIVNRVEALPYPVIAAINGWCIGGGLELALCCDIRLAVDHAQFICAGVNIGLTASAYRLPRTIGLGPAKHMLLAGAPLSVSKAEVFGLVTGVYDTEQLLPEAIALATLIASKAPLAVQATKRIANTALESSLDTAQDIQEKELPILAHSEDHKNALTAFAKKQKPNFSGT